MRILAIGSMYPPHHFGGYELVWQGAMRRARASGHEVRVLASDYLLRDPRGEEDLDVHRTLRWHWSWERNEWIQRGAAGRIGLELHNARELSRHLKEFSPDVVTWWPMGGMSLSLIERVHRRGFPSVLVVHDDWLVYGPRQDPWMRLWTGQRRALGAFFDRVFGLPTRFDVPNWGRFLFNSEYVREQARLHGIDPPDAGVLHPGIDDRFLSEAPDRAWAWRLACVGRIEIHKGVDTAVAAMEHLPSQARLSIVGDGHASLLTELKETAARIGCADRVEFRPAVSADKLPAIYEQSDVIVFPVRWQEPWGLVPLEAMGIGRPVVATAQGGAAEYLRNGENALVVAPDDPNGLAEAVRRLAGDPELRRQVREQGRRTAQRFRSIDFEEQVVAELESTVSASAPPPRRRGANSAFGAS